MGNKQPKNINQFDTRVSKWDRISKVITQSRLENYNQFKLLNIDEKCICAPKKNKKSFFVVQKRIGSESTEGYVFEINVKTKFFVLKSAAKILPVLSIEDKQKNLNEVNIANYLSTLVISNQTIYFPIVYDDLYCKNTIFSNLTKILPNNVLRPFLLSQLNIPDKALSKISLYLKSNQNISDKIFVKNIEHIIFEVTSKKIKINIDKVYIPSTILISELAWGDLRQYIQTGNTLTSFKKLSEKNLIFLLKHIIYAINVLQKHNIVHSDLHTGNILIMIKENDMIPIIHDFGKSEFVPCLTYNNIIQDISDFTSVLDYEITNKKYPILKKCIYDIQKLIKTNKKNRNIMNIITDYIYHI